MARRIVHLLVDDLDGTTMDIGDGETVIFSIDGKSYEIDLTPENAAKLREALQPFIQAARKLPKGATTKTGTPRSNGRSDLRAIRKWAMDNGHDVSPRGRVPDHIVAAYDAAR